MSRRYGYYRCVASKQQWSQIGAEYTVPCPLEPDEMGADEQTSWSPISVSNQTMNNDRHYYIAECFFSRHMKGHFYTLYMEVMLRRLY